MSVEVAGRSPRARARILLRAARCVPLLAAIAARPRAAPLACAAAPRELIEAWLQTTIAAEQRKRSALVKEAEAARAAEKLSKWATLVVANLYRISDDANSVIVEDWDSGGTPTELSFDLTKGTPREQADVAFAKARRLRRCFL